MQSREIWNVDPIRLPPVQQRSITTVTGDRAPVARFCAGCGSSLEGGVVTRGFWIYCSIECAIGTEGRQGRL